MATRTFRGTTDSNWGTATNWLEGAVPTNADDVVFDASSPACTLNVAGVAKTIDFTNYINTITFTNGLTVSGNITLGASMTIAGSASLTCNATATLTSNGKTLGVSLIINGTFTITLADNWTIENLTTNTTASQSITINGNNFYITGSYTKLQSGGSCGGTTVFNFTGTGTISTATPTGSGYSLGNPIVINTAGTVTFSGDFYFGGSSFTYTAGTVTFSSARFLSRISQTWNFNGLIWQGNIDLLGNMTITLLSDAEFTGNMYQGSVGVNGWSGFSGPYKVRIGGNFNCNTNNGITNGNGQSTLVFNGTGTIATPGTSYIKCNVEIDTTGTTTLTGTINYSTGTFSYISGTLSAGTSTLNLLATSTLNLNGVTLYNLSCTVAGSVITTTTATTLSVSNSFLVTGTNASKINLKSSSTGTQANLILLNNGSASQDISFVNVTDINSDGGLTLWDYKGTLSNTNNWNNLTSATGRPTIGIIN